jgi:protein N-terminal methyltransferase
MMADQDVHAADVSGGVQVAEQDQAPAPDAQINHADAIVYWEGIEADVNGMLGGFPYISRVDLQGSRNFLAKIGVGGRRVGLRSGNEEGGKVGRVVDCGAG